MEGAAILDDIARYLKIAVNRLRCKACRSKYNEGSFYVDPEGIRFRPAYVKLKTGKPIYFRTAKGGRKVCCAAKAQEMDMYPVLYMICPNCNESRRVEMPIRLA
jgi:hypothetical protein